MSVGNKWEEWLTTNQGLSLGLSSGAVMKGKILALDTGSDLMYFEYEDGNSSS
jgi:hypothetical protein